jgi:polysaccharide biosynthesis transport protein
MPQQETPFDPRSLLQVIRRGKRLLLLTTLLVLGAAMLASFVITPVFESSVVLRMDERIMLGSELQRMLGQFRDQLGGASNRWGDLRDVRRDLMSATVLAKVIEQAKIQPSPEEIREAHRLALLQPDVPETTHTLSVIAKDLDKRVNLEMVSDAHLKISAKGRSPREARVLAQTLGDVFVSEMARQAQLQVMESLEFSYDQQGRYKKELAGLIEKKTALEREIASGRTGGPVTDQANQSEIETEIQIRNQELVTVRGQVRDLETTLDRLAKGDFRVAPSKMLTEKLAELDRLLGTVETTVMEYVWSDASVRDKMARAARLEDNIYDENERLVRAQYPDADLVAQQQLTRLTNMRHRISVLEKVVSALQSGLERIRSRAAEVPEYKARLEALNNEIQAAQQITDRFDNQLESFQITEALLQKPRYQVVGNAQLPLQPKWPNRLIISALGLGIGLIAGLIILYIRELSDQTLRSVKDVEALLGIEVIGVLPNTGR